MAEPQAEIRLLRETLLGGRGPGATPGEVLAHTRWRTEVGGVPTPDLLEQTAAHTAGVRGEAAPPARGGTRRQTSEPPSALTVVLFAVLLLAARRLFRRQPSRGDGPQMPARAA